VTQFDIHRGGLTPDTPCPADLDLARFVEGTLPADARALMVAHLAECDDCREVVASVVAAQDVEPAHAPAPASAATPAVSGVPAASAAPSRLRGPATWATAVAVAALALIAVRIVVTRPGTPATVADTPAWTEMAEVVGTTRTIEARLSALPAHVPLEPPTRAAGADAGFAAQALAARLAEHAALPADPAVRRAARHAAAVAALIAGRADDAVTRLQDALAETPAAAPERADLLADLAAARAELAEVTTHEHWTAALAAADEALALDAAHEAARFNRALALERLDRAAEARAAWSAIAADGTVPSGWRDEAARHARALVP
jgi:hypothetical protein